MRMMITASFPVETGNALVRNGTLGSTMQKILGELKPEAAYFVASAEGERCGIFFLDMKDSSQIPAVAEPLFLALNARVTFTPVMNAQDLAAAAPALERAAKEYKG